MSKLLSLFTGYGGLDMAVQALTGAELVGVSDIEKGPCAVLAHYHPDVPNLGDIKAIEWDSADVPEFDVLTGGYPCQPFSAAGHRKGTDDPRHLWPYVLKAIKARRPRHVYLENVKGHLSLGFDIVLNDLASVGYNVHWSIMAASSVGAAHRRERLYIYATPSTGGAPYTPELPGKLPVAGHLTSDGLVALARVDEAVRRSSTVLPLFPTPVARDSCGHGPSNLNRKSVPLRSEVTLLPAANDLLPTPTARGHKGASAKNRAGGKALGDIPTLLPTPLSSDHTGGSPKRHALQDIGYKLPALLPTPNTMDDLPAREGEAMERQLRRGEGPDASRRTTMGNLREDIMLTIDPTWFSTDDPDERDKALIAAGLARSWSPFNNAEWGKYAHAVARWAMVLGSLPPAPVEPNTKGSPRLAAAFPAWLMGLPTGYLTNPELGLTRTDIIKMAGNGVVPQAALVAYTHIHQRVTTLHVQ